MNVDREPRRPGMDRQAPREPEGRGDARAQTSTTQLAPKTRRGVLVGGLGALSAIALLHPARAPANAARGLRQQRPRGGEAFVPFPARLPAAVGGTVARFVISVEDRTIEIAPGVLFRAWKLQGRGPGPVLHVRQGQRVEITFHNRGMMAHSFDLHAARVAAGRDFRDVQPGKSMTLAFTAHDPGVFVYHCVTSPAVMHIAAGMYGAMVVTPAVPLPQADHEFVLLGSEWYLSGSGRGRPADVDFGKAMAMQPDVVTFNGFANQYVNHALRVLPGAL